jgi:hypothetical protein
MWWKYALEPLLAVTSLALGANFWNVWKSPRFFESLITNRKMVRDLIKHFGHDRLLTEALKIEPVLGSCYKNILAFQKSSRYALRSAGTLILGLAATVFLLSYFVSKAFMMVNMSVFVAAIVPPLSASTKNNMLNDFFQVVVNVYKWNLEDPDGCLTFISSEARWLNTTLFVVRDLV